MEGWIAIVSRSLGSDALRPGAKRRRDRLKSHAGDSDPSNPRAASDGARAETR